MEKVSAYLHRRDVMALRQEVERFARTHAPLFVACTLATGWIGARFLKSRMPAETRRSATYTPTMPNSAAWPS
jgi:hypothetical protein